MSEYCENSVALLERKIAIIFVLFGVLFLKNGVLFYRWSKHYDKKRTVSNSKMLTSV